MRSSSAQTQTLNIFNGLTAHRVSLHINSVLLQGSLQLVKSLFPREPTAAVVLKQAYDALLSGDRRLEDSELLDYFVYTTGSIEEGSVVGGGGLYRVLEGTGPTLSVLEALRVDPPPGVAFLKDKQLMLEDLVWGGYLAVEPRSARSPHVMPFIIRHILLTAQDIIRSNDLAPVLLAFTLRHNNGRVHRFYERLGFEKTGASLEFEGEAQDVFALNLEAQSSALSRLSDMVALTISHQSSFDRES